MPLKSPLHNGKCERAAAARKREVPIRGRRIYIVYSLSSPPCQGLFDKWPRMWTDEPNGAKIRPLQFCRADGPQSRAGGPFCGGFKIGLILCPAFMGQSCSLPCWPPRFWGLPLGRWFCTAAAGRKRGCKNTGCLRQNACNKLEKALPCGRAFCCIMV